MAAGLVACGGSGPSGEPGKPTALAVVSVGGQREVEVNRTLSLAAEARDAFGSPVALASVQWSTDAAERAVVSEGGVLRAKASGAVRVTARAAGLAADLLVTVRGAFHEGTGAQDEVWRASDNPHRVGSGSYFFEGAGAPTLRLEAGVEVRFERDAALVIADHDQAGKLVIAGTQAAPVKLVANASTPAKGHWAGLRLGASTAGGTSLSWVSLSDCGGVHTPCLELACGPVEPVLDHVSVRRSADVGVQVSRAMVFGPGSAALTVEGSDRHPIRFLDANAVGTLPADSAFSGNAPDAVLVDGGVIDRTQTWPRLGVPYVIDTTVFVHGTGTPVLTLLPGTRLRFGAGSGLVVGHGQAAALVARGTAQEPILFTADAATPGPGHWGGLAFEHDATRACVLQHAIVEYGGSPAVAGVAENANVAVIEEKGPFIRDTVLRHSAGFGIALADVDRVPFTTDFEDPALANSFADNARGKVAVP